MKHSIAPTVIALLLALGSFSSEARGESSRPTATKDIVSTALAAGSFNTLAQALTAADLVDALQGEGPFTVFAPTDEAFARLPEGALAGLLEPSARDRLRAVLLYHVVAGRVRASDLIALPSAKTLGGEAVPFGLRVGDANVVQADIRCTNGIIHVIDRVLLPPAKEAGPDVMGTIVDAIERGAPRYNEGHVDACVEIYETAARTLHSQAADELGMMGRARLARALAHDAHDAKGRAWALRRAFDAILADMTFEPSIEASLPEGFPAPGPVGRVVSKSYPRYRAARAEGGNSFWQLFRHIQKNDVEMTAPVEMTLGDDLRAADMAFLYEAPDQGQAGEQGAVSVLDLEPLEVLSIGMRGRRDAESIRMAKQAIEERLAQSGWERAGDYRLLGYNSPMVPTHKRYWELQIPVRR